jgi:hypothetical protein
MYTILQSSFVLVVQKVFGGSVNGVRGRRERRRIERMSPEELSAWRTKEFDEIHQRAVRLARLQSDKYLSKHGRTRADAIRVSEVGVADAQAGGCATGPTPGEADGAVVSVRVWRGGQ